MVEEFCIKNNNPCLEKGNFLKNDGSKNELYIVCYSANKPKKWETVRGKEKVKSLTSVRIESTTSGCSLPTELQGLTGASRG